MITCRKKKWPRKFYLWSSSNNIREWGQKEGYFNPREVCHFLPLWGRYNRRVYEGWSTKVDGKSNTASANDGAEEDIPSGTSETNGEKQSIPAGTATEGHGRSAPGTHQLFHLWVLITLPSLYQWEHEAPTRGRGSIRLWPRAKTLESNSVGEKPSSTS